MKGQIENDRDYLTQKINMWSKEGIYKNHQQERLFGNSFSDTFVLYNMQRKQLVLH